MAKSEKQKLKLLYILEILYTETDENHPISTKSLIEKLAAHDIKAERKSIYSDIEYLQEFGVDIGIDANKRTGGYYIASRLFELPELKILVDMVQSSRFISEKKSRSLISKLEYLCGKNNAKELNRQVYVSNRVKAQNETIYYSVDKINSAILNNHSISFQYFQYTPSKEMELKNAGKIYHVSPYYLAYANENYYLIGFDNDRGEVRNYRVDKCKRIDELTEERLGSDAFASFDIASYSNSSFGMFGGESRRVTIECTNDLANVVIDRFGKEVNIHRIDDERFSVSINVVCSGQFYGWLAGLGVRARIASPIDVKENYHEYIGNIYRMS